MKKKLKNIYLIIILLVVFLPSVVLADKNCTSEKISGDAISKAEQPGGVNCSKTLCCKNAVCLWNWNTSSDARGVRIQIYKYTGSDTPTRVGKGVDLWDSKKLDRSDYIYTSPNNPNTTLKTKNCNPLDGQSITGYYNLTSKAYLETGQVYYEKDLQEAFRTGLNNYLLVKNSDGTAASGWIKDNILDRIKGPKKNETEVAKLKDLFGLSDADIDDIRANSDDYYITAEVLFRFYANSEEYCAEEKDGECVMKKTERFSTYKALGLQPNHVYNGTASEAARFFGYGDVYNALQSSGGDVGKLVTPGSLTGTFLIQQIAHFLNSDSYYYKSSDAEAVNNLAACNSAYGYAVWTMVCEECEVTKVCKSTCELDYKPGTDEYNECAVNYCTGERPEDAEDKDEDVATCMSNCAPCETYCEKSDDKEQCANDWCDSYGGTNKEECVKTCNRPPTCEEKCGDIDDPTEKNECAKDYCKNEVDVDKCVDACAPVPDEPSEDTPELLYWGTKSSPGCDSNIENKCSGFTDPDETDTKKQVHYSQKTSDCTDNVDGESWYWLSTRSCFSDGAGGKYTPNDTLLTDTYYKIECQEDITLEGLPEDKIKLHVTPAGTSSIYLGYDLGYDRTCALYYKEKPSTGFPTYSSSSSSNITNLSNQANTETTAKWTNDYGSKFTVTTDSSGKEVGSSDYTTKIEYDRAALYYLKKEIQARIKDVNDNLNISTGNAHGDSTPKDLGTAVSKINAYESQNVRNVYRDYEPTKTTCDGWELKKYSCTYDKDHCAPDIALKFQASSSCSSIHDETYCQGNCTWTTNEYCSGDTECINYYNESECTGEHEGRVFNPYNGFGSCSNYIYNWLYGGYVPEYCFSNSYFCNWQKLEICTLDSESFEYNSPCSMYDSDADMCNAQMGVCYWVNQKTTDKSEYKWKLSSDSPTASELGCNEKNCSCEYTDSDYTKRDSCNTAKENVEKLLYQYEEAIKIIDKMDDELQKIQATAERNFKETASRDNSSDASKEVKDVVSLELVNAEGKFESTQEATTITLVPATCYNANDTNLTTKYCLYKDGTTKVVGTELSVVPNGRVKCEGVEPVFENNKSSYSYHIVYALPSSYVTSRNEDARKIFHTKKECEDALDPATGGKCIERKNVWVMEIVAENVEIPVFVKNAETRQIKITMSGRGECNQFQYVQNCSYSFETYQACSDCDKTNPDRNSEGYKECIKANCGCESFCGSNVHCRYTYCPQECPECDGTETKVVEECGDCSDPNSNDQLCCEQNNCSGKAGNDLILCKYENCCYRYCNGEGGCEDLCCISECNELYPDDPTALKECLIHCPDPVNPPNGGLDYVYRPISMNNPFPNRNPGQNWAGRVKYITDSQDTTGRYADPTDGRSDLYEYKIVLTPSTLRAIRNNSEYDTTYTEYKASTSQKNGDIYCSAFLYDYLSGLGGNVVETQGSGGCGR